MRRRSGVGLLAVVVMLAAPVTARGTDDEVLRAYEQQLNRMQSEIDDLRRRLRELEAEREADRRAAEPAPAAPATAAAPADAEQDRAEQDRKIGVLAEELARVKDQLVVPETKDYVSRYGFGPAASSVYSVRRGLSIGGYGEFNYQNFVSDQGDSRDRADFLRFVLYTGYKFSDRIVLNSEIEFEHATTSSTVTSGDGSVSVEFAALDFFLWEPVNVRTGLLLAPVGFINLLHEPTTFFGNLRPAVEQEIIPSTWRELGAGLFGTLAPGLDYQAYVMNSLNAKGYRSTDIRNARQKGNRVLAEDFTGVMRLDYTPTPGLLVGASAALGDAGHDQEFAGEKPGVFTTLWEAHAQAQWRGFWWRALGTMLHISDAELVSEDREQTVASDMWGFYTEIAYDLLPLILPETEQSFEPFFRFEIFDTQDNVPRGFARLDGQDIEVYTVGFSYKPIPRVVLKLDYRNFQNGSVRPRSDELNLGAGFIF